MSFDIHNEPQVHGSAEQQLLLQIEHLKRTVKSPHDLVEHVIQLYGAEFEKANTALATERQHAETAAARAELAQIDLAEQKRANDELFRIKQRVVIANRELQQKNKELTYVVRRFVDELPAKRDWLDPDLEKVARLLLKGQRVLPMLTDELRDAQTRVLNEVAITASDDSGFARDLAALCDFVEQYDKATAKHAQSVRPDGDGNTDAAT